MKIDSVKGHLAAIAINTIFGLNTSITKSLVGPWMTSMGYAVTRAFFAAALFWILGLSSAKQKIPPRDLLVIAAGGLFGPGISQAAFSIGLRLTTPVTWALIAALSPIAVLLLSALFLKEPISLKKALGAAIGICGAAVVLLQNKSSGGSNSWLGIAIALANPLFFAGNIIIIRKVSGKYEPATLMKWMFLSAFVFIAPFGIPELPVQRLFSSEIALKPMLQLGFGLIFSSVIASFLKPVALKRINAASMSMYANLQPLIAAVAAILIGQDVFSWDKPLALILIVAGVYLVSHQAPEKKPEGS